MADNLTSLHHQEDLLRAALAEPALGLSLLSTARHFPMGGMRTAFDDAHARAPARPTLVVWGDLDGTCPYRNARTLCDDVFPHARLRTVRGAKHCIYTEFAAEVAASLVEFVWENRA